MSCTSCYNGCTQTVSDECVRYTGNTSLPLGIDTGDNLLTVETSLINAVVSFLNGTGITITLNPDHYCTLVSQYLPLQREPNASELFDALVRAACELKGQVDGLQSTLNVLNSDYTIDCLEGVTASSDTHDIVQAVINKLCSTATDLAALTLDVNTNYVKLADLDSLIAAYLAGQTGGSTQYYTKMVPYTAVEFYGDITTNFDASGAGVPENGFYKIYLCNGLNGTPDKRGRVGVGAVNGVPGGALDPAVDPSDPFNPDYSVYDTAGQNSVILIESQMPSHSHNALASATSTVTPNPHSHNYLGAEAPSGAGDGSRYSKPLSKVTSDVTLHVDTSVSVINSFTGGNGAHNNIQPVLACNYIMYIP